MSASRFSGRWPLLEQGLLNPTLDLAPYAAEFQNRGVVQIPGILRPDIADLLFSTLEHEVPWSLAYRDAGGNRRQPLAAGQTPSNDGAARLDDARRDEEIFAIARAGRFQFRYRTYMLVSSYLDPKSRPLPLHRWLELINRGDWLAAMRRITGEAGVARLDGQATCYRAGDFLTRHDDAESDDSIRYAAYVLSLTRDWRADWGGLLQMLGPDGAVTETLLPRFNCLNLFRTPRLHCVSPVAPYVTVPRYAITGWLMPLARPPA